MNQPQPKSAAIGKWWDHAASFVSGCTRVSEDCRRCWSLANEHRFKVDGSVCFHPERLDKPLRVRKPCVWAAWNDLFHPDVTDAQIDSAFAVMALSPRQTFVVLTKRAERMQKYLESRSHSSKFWEEANTTGFATRYEEWSLIPFPLPNLIVGTTAENQRRADERIPLLLATPAVYRMVSVEPMLSRVNLDLHQETPDPDGCYEDRCYGIHLVVVGCETGAGRRPCALAWIIDVVEQCRAAGVPVWVKAVDLGKRISHDPAEWPPELTRLGNLREFVR